LRSTSVAGVTDQITLETGSQATAVTIDTSGRTLFNKFPVNINVAQGTLDGAGAVPELHVQSMVAQSKWSNDIIAADHRFAKSRATSPGGTGTIVQNADALGSIRFSGDLGSSLGFAVAAWITAQVDAVPSTTSMPGRLVFKTSPVGNININNLLNALVLYSDQSAAFGGTVTPLTNDVGALGTGALAWSDLFLASGGVINWGNGAFTLTETDTTHVTLSNGNPNGDTYLVISNTNTGASADAVLQFLSGDGTAARCLFYSYHAGGYSSLEASAGEVRVSTLQAGANVQIIAASQMLFKTNASVLAMQITAGQLIGIGGAPSHFLDLLQSGTTTTAPLRLKSGTNLTTAVAGAVEFDGVCFYSTAVASARQVVNAEQIQVLSANRTFTNNTSAQAIFNATANGAVTLAAATTYEFEMYVAVTGLSSSAHTVNLGFGGTATFTGIAYRYNAQTGTTLAGPTADSSGWIAVATATAVVASGTTTGLLLIVRGIMRINAGGTVIPQLTQVTASTAAVVQLNSFFRCWPIGSNTVTNVGNWS
jgi:hypothetical protein